MHDVCVIGHVTKDVIRLNGRIGHEMPGGVVHYAGIAFQALGLDAAVVTKAAKEDADTVLRQIRELGVKTYCHPSEVTTVFENIYSGNGYDFRRQKVRSVATAFHPRDLGEVRARAFHLGPLTSAEMSVEFLKAVSERGSIVFLDVQGFVRKIEEREVRLVDWPDKWEGLAYVDILKANPEEAWILSGEQHPERAARALANVGPKEIIVTLGSRGSLIVAEGRLYRVPAFAPRTVADPTGCGDSYSAGYIFHRGQSDDIEAAGRFAAALATLKLERKGPFIGNVREVRARLRDAEIE